VTAERGKAEAYARALLEVARAEGTLGGVEDDLFRFARTLESSDELRLALTDPVLPVERRIAVIEDLTGGKALQTSTALLSMLVAAGQASELPVIVDRFVELAAAERKREVAEVRSAIPLDDAQTQRLAAALGRATGKDVEVKVIVDPSVMGGIVARVGDTVIDGSVRHRLELMKERHA
jgi:F-type H+-transporting ATPase subunit delta